VNFPRRIRSEVTIAHASDADTDEVCRSIARNLESLGATNIETWEALIGFRGGEARTGQLGCEALVREQKR